MLSEFAQLQNYYYLCGSKGCLRAFQIKNRHIGAKRCAANKILTFKSLFIMKHKILFAVMLLIASVISSTTHAQQITPEISIEMEPDRYVIHFVLPPYWIENEDGNDYEDGNQEGGIDDDCGVFSEIVMDGDIAYDLTDIPGYPELPFFSINLLLPGCASSINAHVESSVIEPDYLPYNISPARRGSWIDENGIETELDSECYNAEYYFYGFTNEYPFGFYRDFYQISNVYSFMGYKGITLSVFPFSYYPELGYMDVLREGTIVIELDCGDLLSTIDEVRAANDFNSMAAQLYYDTFNETEVYNVGFNGDYLIVAAHREMEESLMPYVHYKRLQNYNTEIIYLDELGGLGNANMIEYLIYNNNILPCPNFVLLVGSLNDIPPHSGLDNPDIPYTDDYYHSLLGRWVIGEAWDEYGPYADLRDIVEKTINTETDYISSPSTAALFSGIDSKKRISKKFYRNMKYVAQKSFDLMGIPYTLYDGRNYTPNQAYVCMESAIQNHVRFFVYNGHGYSGGTASGIGKPYELMPGNIWMLENSSPTPMGFGFSCSLNTYNTDNNFGAKWVANETGGVTFYGATTPSYQSSDHYFARKIFKYLRKITNSIDNFPISVWLRMAETSYYWSLPNWYREIQIEKYNLIGDPTLAVYGMDAAGSYAPFHIKKKDNTNGLMSDSIIKSVEIYDIKGHQVAVGKDSQSTRTISLPSGVYVVRTIYRDGSISTNKIIK